ncbi:beta-lactamase [Vibrio alginolyticus]|jgi:beta-lactamase class C|uniref:Beta-lactamase n=4 Tax=Vibrio TaxID=662 RepID=A0A1W6TJR7_VIBAL|nr:MULTISPECIES: class C beta-lactamase [Vibrio]MDG2721004.1 beta-lactamase [Vibrio parahaemolyticus]NAW94766.1 class C beta-lactamase [Vibrio sp. V42_P2S4T144]ARP01227.1 class C beta-lactamase CMY-2 [Vibrio alginolyticus]ARP05933.1 class C beta-lactamase CMY-2 [Vibrio alginolyticus]ARP11038.1 class C beta-lactamase CMY-2 [Vibrio alginolyticus]
MKLNNALLAILSLTSFVTFAKTELTVSSQLKSVVDECAKGLINEYDIPGLAVAVTIDGKRYFYNYGLADVSKGSLVTNDTIFELGSISKTFAATLTGYAQEKGKLDMDDKVKDYIPELENSALGNTKLVNVATYTAGGLPLQFPSEVTNDAEMMQYYKTWKPEYEAGTKRKYSNPSIGLFGYIGALSMKSDYTEMMETVILPELGMTNTFVDVPKDKLNNYAFGYSSEGKPVRVNPGILDAQAYGIKSTSLDMLQYIEANMGQAQLNTDIENALERTHTKYFDTDTFTQAVGWEGYDYPVSLSQLLKGNSSDVILKAKPVQASVSGTLGRDVWYNKTGSTGGFGAYVAYVPSEKIGIVILANKNYPNAERVEAAYHIISSVVK